MCAQQRVHGCRGATRRPIVNAFAVIEQEPVRPRRQRSIDQAALGTEHREVHCRTSVVQIRQQATEPQRQWLLPPHTGQRGNRHAYTAGNLIDRVGQQRVRRKLGEDSVPVVERRAHRSGEPHGVAQIVGPVTRVARRRFARVSVAE